MLACQSLGASTNWPRVVLAHGFTQNARCWGPFGQTIGERYGTIAVDAPGHGQSGHDDADLSEAGRLLIEAGGPGHYFGYSMGGRMLLHGVLDDHIGAVRSLVLMGATAGIEEAEERSARAISDRRTAQTLLKMGTAAFVDEWLTNPMFAELTDEQSCKAKRLENHAEGMAASLVHCGTGSQESLWSALPRIEIPVLVLAGNRDDKFTKLGQRMAEMIGDNATFMAVEGGHAAHLENPKSTAAAVLSWIDRAAR